MNLQSSGTVKKTNKTTNKFYKFVDNTKKDVPYTYTTYIQILEEKDNQIIFRGIQFSSDNNICVAWNRILFKDEFRGVKITKAQYNSQVKKGNTQIEKLLAI